MPRSSLMAAVRDRINGANGLIPSNGFPLGQQLVTVKAGHLPTQITRRGIDQKKCMLLSTRRTSRPWSAGVLENSSNQRGQFNVRRLGHPRIQAHPPLQPLIVAPVTNARRQAARNTKIAPTSQAGSPCEARRGAGRNDQQKEAFSYAESSRRHCLLGSVTNFSPRTAAGPRRDFTIGRPFPGYPHSLFLIEKKNDSANPSICR